MAAFSASFCLPRDPVRIRTPHSSRLVPSRFLEIYLGLLPGSSQARLGLLVGPLDPRLGSSRVFLELPVRFSLVSRGFILDLWQAPLGFLVGSSWVSLGLLVDSYRGLHGLLRVSRGSLPCFCRPLTELYLIRTAPWADRTAQQFALP